MHRVIQVEPLDEYRLHLTFGDGTKGVVNLSGLVGKGVFGIWRDPERFRRVRIGEAGQLDWDGDVDLCPDALYLQVTGRSPSDVFPRLRRAPSHA